MSSPSDTPAAASEQPERRTGLQMTIQDVLSLVGMFQDPALIRELMETPLERIVDRLRDAAQVARDQRTVTVDKNGVVLTLS